MKKGTKGNRQSRVVVGGKRGARKKEESLIETFHNTFLIRSSLPDTTRSVLSKPKYTLDNAQLCSSCVQTRYGKPVVDDQARANDGATAIHGASDEGDLEEGGEFILIADRGLGVNDTTLV